MKTGVGEDVKGGFGGYEKVWKEMRRDRGRGVGGSKVWGEVREMWAVGEGKGRCGKKYGECRQVWRKCGKRWGKMCRGEGKCGER